MNVQPTDSAAVNKLIADIQSSDDKIRGPAWQGATAFGAIAVKPLAAVMARQDFEIARAARRALWKIVRHVGRPKAGSERKAVQSELIALLNTAPNPIRREAAWMLSEIGDADAVEPLAALLADTNVREDARCALERIPGSNAVRALEKSLKTVPEDFRPALANSLRARGRKLEDYPGQKLVPRRQTPVEKQ